jgi:hypothetical protein
MLGKSITFAATLLLTPKTLSEKHERIHTLDRPTNRILEKE